MSADTEDARNRARLLAACEISALRTRAPDLVDWLLEKVERRSRSEARRERDARLRALGAQCGSSVSAQAATLEWMLRQYAQGRRTPGLRETVGPIFALGVPVPRSRRQLERVLTTTSR